MRELKRERKAMLQRMVEAKAIFQENQQLKAALQLREHEPRHGRHRPHRRLVVQQPAPLRDPFGRHAATASQVGMPVRSPDGLVGRIIDAGALASRVLLVSDRANIVPARLLRGGIPVIAQGRGDGTIDVRPLEVGRNPFKRGDIIITSGTGGLYPPLVPIARVVKLDDDGAVALPLADPATTSFAIVEPPFEPAAVAAENAQPRPRRPDGPRRARLAAADRPGPDAASRCSSRRRSVVVGVAARGACRSSRPAAGIPISASSS